MVDLRSQIQLYRTFHWNCVAQRSAEKLLHDALLRESSCVTLHHEVVSWRAAAKMLLLRCVTCRWENYCMMRCRVDCCAWRAAAKIVWGWPLPRVSVMSGICHSSLLPVLPYIYRIQLHDTLPLRLLCVTLRQEVVDAWRAVVRIVVRDTPPRGLFEADRCQGYPWCPVICHSDRCYRYCCTSAEYGWMTNRHKYERWPLPGVFVMSVICHSDRCYRYCRTFLNTVVRHAARKIVVRDAPSRLLMHDALPPGCWCTWHSADKISACMMSIIFP